MGRRRRKRYHSPGTQPGTLTAHAEAGNAPVRITAFLFDAARCEERTVSGAEIPSLATPEAGVLWLDVTGLSDPGVVRAYRNVRDEIQSQVGVREKVRETTVLARTAAAADAAATVIANAVNLDDARVKRRPACELKDDSDLGNIAVTVDVPALEPAGVECALQAGATCARELRAAGLIWSAALVCQGRLLTLDAATPVILPHADAARPPGRREPVLA